MKVKYNPEKNNRRSIRLRGYDYSRQGAYFVTLRVHGDEPLFGYIEDGAMILSEIGQIAEAYWREIPGHFRNVELDEFIVMPDHVHGIIIIEGGETPPQQRRRGEVASPESEVASPIQRPTLGQIVAYYKYQTTKKINQIHNTPGNRFWQRNYYERIIRRHEDINNVRRYIMNNPLKWELGGARSPRP